MLLSRHGRVEVRWAIGGDVAVETLDPPLVFLAGAWHPAELDGADVVLIVAGPDAPDAHLAPDGVVLPVGAHAPVVRFDDNPEVLAEGAGIIVVA